MLCMWSSSEAPQGITKIECINPIVGHSFVPPDKMFRRLEKPIHKQSVLIAPEEYIQIFKSEETVISVIS
ncbi:hypothetical protein PR048_026611 [Dryococelus australis]|uniref:Uncharacterized protein n=1 Tax=Dryococelus australis TaxID=614101 RepID=A0ABQ9GLU8_9NEOP|nr:hypothetical protein PR048_026611 [Dryococelus australis]